MNIQNRLSSVAVGLGNLDNPVKSSRAEKCGVKDINPVCGADNLDIAPLLKAVKVGKELHKGSLNLSVAGGEALAPVGADGVNLVYEDYRRRLLLCVLKKLADEACALTDILLNEFGTYNPHELRICLVSHGSCKQSLTRSRRTVEKHSLRRRNAHLLE